MVPEQYWRELANRICCFCNLSLSKSNIFHMGFKGASILLQSLSIKMKRNCLGFHTTSAVFADPLYRIKIFFQATLFFDAQNNEKQTCANMISLQIQYCTSLFQNENLLGMQEAWLSKVCEV